MNENELSNIVIGASIRVHNSLGPGLLESTYKECLFYEIRNSGLFVEKEKPLPLIYEEKHIGFDYRIDILVGKKLVIEIKSIDVISKLHLAQLLTYLKLSECKLGLLINFNVRYLKNGIRRVVNEL